MDVPAQKHQDQLERIKKSVKRAYDYFKPNYDRYNEFRKFVFESSLSADDVTLLQTISRPQLEFNVLEAYISRLLGEFSKQEPAVSVNAEDPKNVDVSSIQVVEQHLRHVLSDSNSNHTRYEVYKDLLSGGFSTLKIHTEYSSKLSMKQEILIDRVFDPTLCGFDHLARLSHKGDGKFCFELFPMDEEDFKVEYPNIKIEKVNFRRDFSGFNWSYMNDNSKTMIVCDYYEKKKKNVKIAQISNGKVMPVKDYNKMIAEWTDITAPPVIVGEPRTTIFEKIVRYRCIENIVIEYEETDFEHLPLIFVDGSSVLIKTKKNGNIRQICRPYVYHAKGAQRLKNFAGISLANEIENILQHKFAVAKEALPKEEDFLEAWKDTQKASVLVYNSVYEENPAQPINMPFTQLQRPAAPPEIMNAFQGTDSAIQQILGSYDASLGINNNQLSGIAVVEGATQSNAAAMPYVVGFMQGLQRAAQVYVDLLPKYYSTPRTIPLKDEEGKRYYVEIGEDDRPFEFSENVLNVTVEASASFQVQKSKTIMMVKEMMGMSPLFAQFIAEKGLNFVLDNMEGKNIEQLKKMVDGWVQEQQQQKQQEQQMEQQEQQNNPAMMRVQIEKQKLQFESQKLQMDMQLQQMKMEMEQKKLHSSMSIAHNKNATELFKQHDQQELEKMKISADVMNKDKEILLKHMGKSNE